MHIETLRNIIQSQCKLDVCTPRVSFISWCVREKCARYLLPWLFVSASFNFLACDVCSRLYKGRRWWSDFRPSAKFWSPIWSHPLHSKVRTSPETFQWPVSPPLPVDRNSLCGLELGHAENTMKLMSTSTRKVHAKLWWKRTSAPVFATSWPRNDEKYIDLLHTVCFLYFCHAFLY